MADKPRNAMQAVLDRAAQQPPPALPEPANPAPAVATPRRPGARSVAKAAPGRSSRQNTKLIGGHFRPELARQLRMLAAEEDTTIQALLEEAIQLLLTMKARAELGSAGW